MASVSHNFNLLTFAKKNTLHKRTVASFRDIEYMWWRDQDLELQEWYDCIESKNKIILDILMLVLFKNPSI